MFLLGALVGFLAAKNYGIGLLGGALVGAG